MPRPNKGMLACLKKQGQKGERYRVSLDIESLIQASATGAPVARPDIEQNRNIVFHNRAPTG
jgi:hypothetical protein